MTKKWVYLFEEVGEAQEYVGGLSGAYSGGNSGMSWASGRSSQLMPTGTMNWP